MLPKLVVLSLVLVSAQASPRRLPVPHSGLGRIESGNDVKNSTTYIIGGVVAKKGDNPHMCTLRLMDSHFCGAAIISDTWAVTAAHCIDGNEAASFTLRCATLYHDKPGLDYKIAELIVHPSFDSWYLDNDIGLVRIDGKFELGTSDLDKIALPVQGADVLADELVKVVGWGFTSTTDDGFLSDVLLTITVPVVARDVCRQRYNDYNDVTERMFCAGYDEGGKDACTYDSGGPVVWDNQLVGVVSWGDGCAKADRPGVYTRVGQFRDWINEKTNV